MSPAREAENRGQEAGNRAREVESLVLEVGSLEPGGENRGS